jgi:hypothetical protein
VVVALQRHKCGCEQITKSVFQARNVKAVEEARKQLQDARARAQAGFEARRTALLDRRAAALAEANKKVEAEIAKLVAADTSRRRQQCGKRGRTQVRQTEPSRP